MFVIVLDELFQALDHQVWTVSDIFRDIEMVLDSSSGPTTGKNIFHNKRYLQHARKSSGERKHGIQAASSILWVCITYQSTLRILLNRQMR
jgi:hypothetical protein